MDGVSGLDPETRALLCAMRDGRLRETQADDLSVIANAVSELMESVEQNSARLDAIERSNGLH